MKPVDQTTFGFPGGNCFSACVASLLELPIDDVPYFMHTDDDPAGEKWFDRFEAWLRPYGFWAIFLRLASPNDDWAPAGWCILGGRSPRARPGREDDDLHTVVAFGREVRHDPHPSRKGLVDVRDCMVLVPLDPALPQRRYERGVEDGRRQVVEENPVRCNGCLKPVPLARYCYAVPMCYGCLPPPDPLPVCHVAPGRQARYEPATNADEYAKRAVDGVCIDCTGVRDVPDMLRCSSCYARL